MTIADLLIKLSVDSKGVSHGINEASKEFKEIGNKVSTAVSGLVGLGAFEELTRRTIDYAGHISDLSARTGISTGALQEFDYAAKQSGASVDEVTSALEKLAQAQTQALGGDSTKQNAFARLGVSLSQLKEQRPEQVFKAIANNLKDIPQSAQLVNDMVETLGRSSTNLLPAFRDGFSDAAESARELGIVIDSDIIQKLDHFGDTFGTIGKQVISTFAPVVAWMSGQFDNFRAGVAYLSAALGSLSVDFQKNKLGTLVDLLLPTAGKDNALGRAKAAGEDAAASIFGEMLSSRKGPGSMGGAPDIEAAAQIKEVEKLREKNASALNDLLDKQMSKQERLNKLYKERAELAAAIVRESDPLRREELVSQDIKAIQDIQSIKTNATSKRSLSTPAVDHLERIGLFRGGMNDVKLVAESQLNELRQANRKLGQIERHFTEDY